MQHNDASSETIARAVHLERRRLAATFKELTPEPLRSRIYDRTLAVYGDRLGPSIEWLRARGKTWDDIIDSATNPGPRFSFDVRSIEDRSSKAASTRTDVTIHPPHPNKIIGPTISGIGVKLWNSPRPRFLPRSMLRALDLLMYLHLLVPSLRDIGRACPTGKAPFRRGDPTPGAR